MISRTNLIKSTILFTLVLLFCGPAFGQRPEPEVYGEFQGDPMYTLLPPDAIPAIDEPEYLTGDEASAQMDPGETIMGIATKAGAVCWSTWHLDEHEIVNDFIGDTPIAASW
ncbi:MAG: DUF3179 domain-containing protein [Gemmatimonadales bacterium]|nr:DUF3179 domain-containing protein [Gemmatimonadales bacterium]